MNYKIEQERILLAALELYVADIENRRKLLHLSGLEISSDLKDQLNIANDLIINLPATELERAKQCRDMELSANHLEGARMIQLYIDELEARLK